MTSNRHIFNKHTLINNNRPNSDSDRLDRGNVEMDKLTEVQAAFWGEQATQALLAEEMLGTEVFTDALTKIANSQV